MSHTLDLRAPAKVNLFLQVLGKRADGYHELRMFLAPVSLFDDLRLTRLADEGRIEVIVEGAQDVDAGERNLCHRAARFYFERSGQGGGVRVELHKRIPVGAGLGGGSSDAAATILGLERLCGATLSAADRRDAAFRVGADVPFFFARGAAWVEGVGEAVTAVPAFDPLWLVLVHPGVFLSTASVFSRVTKGLTSPGRPPTIPNFRFQGFVEGLRNDLEPAARALEPAVGQVLDALERVGAPGALMSGSGSAAFGLFPDEEHAREAASRLAEHPGRGRWRVEVVRTLSPGRFPYLA